MAAVNDAVGVTGGVGVFGLWANTEAGGKASLGDGGSAGEKAGNGAGDEAADTFDDAAEGGAGGEGDEAISEAAEESVARGEVEGALVAAVVVGAGGEDGGFGLIIGKESVFRHGGAAAGLEVTTDVAVSAGDEGVAEFRPDPFGGDVLSDVFDDGSDDFGDNEGGDGADGDAKGEASDDFGDDVDGGDGLTEDGDEFQDGAGEVGGRNGKFGV